jgi:hypothetical protein
MSPKLHPAHVMTERFPTQSNACTDCEATSTSAVDENIMLVRMVGFTHDRCPIVLYESHYDYCIDDIREFTEGCHIPYTPYLVCHVTDGIEIPSKSVSGIRVVNPYLH